MGMMNEVNRYGISEKLSRFFYRLHGIILFKKYTTTIKLTILMDYKTGLLFNTIWHCHSRTQNQYHGVGGGVLQTDRTLCNFVDPISISRANSFPFPTSQRESSRSGTLNPCTRSVSPASPSCIAKASARAMFDCVGCIKMSSGFDLDRGVFG